GDARWDGVANGHREAAGTLVALTVRGRAIHSGGAEREETAGRRIADDGHIAVADARRADGVGDRRAACACRIVLGVALDHEVGGAGQTGWSSAAGAAFANK